MAIFLFNLMSILIAITLSLAVMIGIMATWRRIQKKDAHVLMKWILRFTLFLTCITILVSILAFIVSIK